MLKLIVLKVKCSLQHNFGNKYALGELTSWFYFFYITLQFSLVYISTTSSLCQRSTLTLRGKNQCLPCFHKPSHHAV